MNTTCNVSELIDNSTDNAYQSSSIIQKQGSNGVQIVISVLVVFLATVVIWSTYMLFAKLRSLIAWPITPTPTIPKWLGPQGCRQKRLPQLLESGIKIQTRILPVNGYQGAIAWIQEILKAHITGFTCLVSVPMKSFKCGSEPTDFEPLSGVAPGSQFTYQMCGDNRIQITRYVERGVAYVAGYCIYINDPNAWKVNYNVRHIQKCYKGPRYVLPSPPANWSFQEIETVSMDALSRCSSVSSLGFPDSEDLEEVSESIQLTTESLKSHFCKATLEPVLIGWESGILKHFQWSRDTKSFETSKCSSCEAVGDSPPAYQWLNV